MERVKGSRSALGQERRRQGCLIGMTEALTFDQQSAQTGMDGQLGQQPAQFGHTLIIHRAQHAQQSQAMLHGRIRRRF
jgi:hypothetical protein